MALAYFAMRFLTRPLAGLKSINLPPDGVQLNASTLPGCAKAQAICQPVIQPSTSSTSPPPRRYWDATAKRMKVVFKALIADEDIPLIVEYLVKTNGYEQRK